MESPEQLLEAMQPWLRALSSSRIVGDCIVGLVKHGHPADERVLEALELLALLGEIDCNAWKRAILSTWPDKTSLVASVVEKPRQLVCKLSFNHGESIPDVDAWLKRVVRSRSEDEHSPGCMHLRRRLEAAYAYRENDVRSLLHRSVPRDRFMVPMSVGIFADTLIEIVRMFAGILAIQQATVIASDNKSVELKPLLRVQSVSPSTQRDRSLSPEAMRYVLQIVECGGFLEHLSIRDMDTSESGMELVTKGLQRLMGCDNDTRAGKRRSEKGMAVLVSGDLTRSAVAAVFSALSTSQTVRVVHLEVPHLSQDTTEAEDLCRWRWIAYALFSRYATHSIRHVSIDDDDISMKNIAYVAELLQHPNPLALLCGDEDARTIPDTAAVVTAARYFLSLPSTDLPAQRELGHHLSQQKVSILPRSPTNRVEGYESVLVPGYGLAWVRESDIQEHSVCSTHPSCSPTSLSFRRLTPEGMDAGTALLKLVGHNITAFESDLSHVPVDTWLLDVLACVPSLERLSVSCGCLESLDIVATAFERGLCRVQDVEMRSFSLLRPSTGPAFFQKLADPDHPMSKSLRSIYVSYRAPNSSTGPVSDALNAVLAANYRLNTIDVEVDCHETNGAANEPQFTVDETDRTPIHERKMPLDLRTKLAFLSVVTRDNGRPMAMAADAVSRVFQFAAECKKRRVRIEIYEGDEGGDE